MNERSRGGGRREDRLGGSLDLLSASSRRIPSASRLDGSRPLHCSARKQFNTSACPRPPRHRSVPHSRHPPLADRAGSPPRAPAALGPHLSFGSRGTRERCAQSICGAGARASPPGVRRGHALPGAGGEAARLPSAARRAGALLCASPRDFPECTPRPTPALPHPGETGRGPRRRDPGRAALRSALLSALHGAASRVGTPRPRRREGRQGPSAHGFGKEGCGSETNSGDPREGQRPGARCELLPEVRTRSALPSRVGEGLPLSAEERGNRVCTPPGGSECSLAAPPNPGVGKSRLRPPASHRPPPTRRGRRGCHVSPAATPSRLCCGSWPPASLPLPDSSCQKGGMLSSRLESPRGAGPLPAFWGARWYLLEQVRTACGQGEVTEVGEDPASPTQKGKGEKEVSWFPGGIRSGEGDQGVR